MDERLAMYIAFVAPGRSRNFKHVHLAQSDKYFNFEIVMPTIDMILKELKNVPPGKLENLYAIIHSLRTNVKKTDRRSQKILSFAGSFSDLSERAYE